ncbi:MAG: hypothetical protein ABH877_03405 [bacterium]
MAKCKAVMAESESVLKLARTAECRADDQYTQSGEELREATLEFSRLIDMSMSSAVEEFKERTGDYPV